MTGDVTPAAMLRDYRGNADEFLHNQARMFRRLSADQQRELLFYMAMHASMSFASIEGVLMALAGRLKPNGGQDGQATGT